MCWTDSDAEFVRANIGTLTHAQIANALSRSVGSVKAFCAKHKQTSRALWTAEEDQRLRSLYGTMTSRQIAQAMGRHLFSVRNRCHALQLGASAGRTRIYHGADFEAFIREKHALGWSSRETADAYSPRVGRRVDRHTVAHWWKRLGLPSNLYSAHQRQKARVRTGEQLKAAGIPSLAQLRLRTWAEHAKRLGWPDDLRPRAIQILHALYTTGPMTRKELAEAIGMPWLGSRKSLHSNDPEGSYLAHLMKRGLVVSLGRCRKFAGKGRGSSIQVYSLPLHVQPQTNTEVADGV